MIKISDVVQDQFGNAINGATVTVRVANASPGTGALASIYAADGTGLIAGSVVTTDSLGHFSFYVAEGRYDYTIAGSGITTQVVGNLGEKEPYFNVNDFGAIGDGATDDTVAIQAAITAAANGVLVIPANTTYAVGSQLTISNPMVVLCYGTLKAITTGSSGTPLILITASNVRFSGEGIGTLNGNSKSWSCMRADGNAAGAVLDNIILEKLIVKNWSVGIANAEGLSLFSVRNGVVRQNFLNNIGNVAATNGTNGFGIYLQYCQGCIVEDNYLDTVGNTGINASAGVYDIIKNNIVRKATLFGLKGGYGTTSAVLAAPAPSTTSFSLTKATASTTKVFVGSFVEIITSNTTKLNCYIKAITDNGTTYTYTTTTMSGTPSTGQSVYLPNTGTLVEGNCVEYVAENGMDFNQVKDMQIRNNTLRFCGQYTGAGAYTPGIGSAIWVGADAIGAVQAFDSDNVLIQGNTITDCYNSAIAAYSTPHVNICNNICIDYYSNGAGVAAPSYGGIEVNRQTFARILSLNVNNNTLQSSNGYGVLVNFFNNGNVCSNIIKSRCGISVNSAIAAHLADNVVQATGATAYGLLIADPTAVNPNSDVTMSGNDIRFDVFGASAYSVTDGAPTFIREIGPNLWQNQAGTFIAGSGTVTLSPKLTVVSDVPTSTVTTGTAPLTIASTTPVANLTCAPTTYNSGGTQQVAPHIVFGSGTLVSGTPSTLTVTLSGSAIFTNSSSYVVTVSNGTTAANALKVTYASGSSFTITGPNTITDAVTWMAVGI